VQKQGGGGGGVGGALLLWDVATPRRCRRGSGALTAAEIPGDGRKKYELKLQLRVTGTSSGVCLGSFSPLIAFGKKSHE